VRDADASEPDKAGHPRGKIVEECFTYVNPEAPFDDFNTRLTGISAETVCNAPTFPELWQQIRELFGSGILVAHNAPFDMGVLKKRLKDYSIPWKERARYCCTVQIGRRELPDMSHSLDSMCGYYGIALDHHKAVSDSHAAAEILLRHMSEGVRWKGIRGRSGCLESEKKTMVWSTPQQQ
jgi:DNA polymerase-3 subunit epsilon